MKDNGAPRNRLRELRDRSRLTQDEVSTLTGISVDPAEVDGGRDE